MCINSENTHGMMVLPAELRHSTHFIYYIHEYTAAVWREHAKMRHLIQLDQNKQTQERGMPFRDFARMKSIAL